MTRFTIPTFSNGSNRLGKDTSAFFCALASLVLGALAGYFFSLITGAFEHPLVLSAVRLYKDCVRPLEYALCAAKLSAPILIETAVLWLGAYVSFEKPFLLLFFAFRGIFLGAALTALMTLETPSPLSWLLLSNVVITASLLILTRAIRNGDGTLPMHESVIYALTSAGVSGVVYILSSLFSSGVL